MAEPHWDVRSAQVSCKTRRNCTSGAGPEPGRRTPITRQRHPPPRPWSGGLPWAPERVDSP